MFNIGTEVDMEDMKFQDIL